MKRTHEEYHDNGHPRLFFRETAETELTAAWAENGELVYLLFVKKNEERPKVGKPVIERRKGNLPCSSQKP